MKKIQNTIIKVLNDTLKNKKGKYSRKSVTMLFSFLCAIIVGFFIVISDIFLDREINRYSIDVFHGFLLLTASLVGAVIVDKKLLNKNEDTEED